MATKLGTEAKQSEAFHVGSVWYTSWGYDQTNVDYYQVVRESESSVWLRKIGSYVENGRLYPNPGMFLGAANEKGHLHRKNGFPRGEDGDFYLFLTMTSYASAYPYDGGGKYDTRAAGQEGH